MSFKITSEAQLLDAGIRKKLIEEINGPENARRKAEAFRRYECFKDRTDVYVLELLMKQFDEATVNEMQYAITNVSFTRKIVDKLARVYSNGVKRTVDGDEAATKAVEELAKALKFNQLMKKTNRLLKLERNLALYVKPVPGRAGKFDLACCALAPFLYDVIEDPHNAEKPLAYILSSYKPERSKQYYALDAGSAGRTQDSQVREVQQIKGDGMDQAIADTPFDGANEGEYIWWSPNLHFTTNDKGELIRSSTGSVETTNPIGRLPFVNFAADQDGNFWAQGGRDIADGGVKINALLTHVAHIAVTQGYGQLYMTGKGLPKSIKTGPNKCVQLEQEDGEIQPQIGYLTANPPIGDLVSLVEMYIALWLSTNNLSTSNFASSLQGGKGLASGVALLIDKAESIEDVEDQAEIFRDSEPEAWAIIAAWQALYGGRNLLSDKFSKYKVPLDPVVSLQFNDAKTIESEKEKLDIIKQRIDLGLNTMVELIMRDNPSLNEEQAKERLKKILEEKIQRQLDAREEMTAKGAMPLGEQPPEGGKKPSVKEEDPNDQGGGQPGLEQQDDNDNRA